MASTQAALRWNTECDRSPPLSPHALREASGLEDYATVIHNQLIRQGEPAKAVGYTRRPGIPSKPPQRVKLPLKRQTTIPKLTPAVHSNNGDGKEKKPRKRRRARVPASSNQWTSVATHIHEVDDAQIETDNEDEDDGRIHAGVYVLENRKTGHRFFGTTWDLKNAAAQAFADLEDGSHPHHALVTCFQLYGREASAIHFRVLERVQPPALSTVDASAPNRKRSPQVQTFDVNTMETLLRQRLAYHQRRIVRQSAGRLVHRLLVYPFLAEYFPKWRGTTAYQQENEHMAAAVVVQSLIRRRLAVRLVNRQRRERAMHTLSRFFRFCMLKLVLLKRKRRQERHTSAIIIQRTVRALLERCRRHHHALKIRQWLRARTIQRVYRGHKGRAAASSIRAFIRRNQASRHLQRVVRGFLVRRRVLHQRWREYKMNCAIRIQSQWRGVLARMAVRRFRIEQIADKRRHAAASRIQALFHLVKQRSVTQAVETVALYKQQATRIHLAYKNYVAKKFGWAATTFALEHSSALRIQRVLRRWFFFHRIRALLLLKKHELAAIQIQRMTRGFCARCRVDRYRRALRRDQAARRLQRLWRLYSGRLHMQSVLCFWRMDKSARRIQARYCSFHARRLFLVVRTQARRDNAAVRIQNFVRCVFARREWRRRVLLRREGPCEDCGDAVAIVFCYDAALTLCSQCLDKWTESLGVVHAVDVSLHPRQQECVIHIQRVYRGHRTRLTRRYGQCGFCGQHPNRIHCYTCVKRYCWTCDSVFHEKLGHQKAHERRRVEIYLMQEHAAVRIQAQVRRSQQRDTLARRRVDRQDAAATRIQRIYKSHNQRRVTRAIVAAQHERTRLEAHAATRIQRQVRGFLARNELQSLRERKRSTTLNQRVYRGHRARQEAQQRREQRNAAVCIQRVVRGHMGRRRARLRREQVQREMEQSGAVCIQCHIRGWLTRRRLWMEKAQRAAVRIQCAWRRYEAQTLKARLARERQERWSMEETELDQRVRGAAIELAQRSATLIQNVVRQRQARQELARRRLVRAKMRREHQRALWIRVEAASAGRIQRWVRRGWLAQTYSRRLRVHCVARQYLARQVLRRLRLEKYAIVRIQRAFRYARVKRRLTRLVSLESHVVHQSGHCAWVELLDEASGCVYYYNRETAESTWDRPSEMDAVDAESPEWVEYWDATVDAAYYYNTKTGEATWTTPEGMDNQHEDTWIGASWPPGAPIQDIYKDEWKQKTSAAPEMTASEDVMENQWPQDAYGGYYVDANGYAYAYGYEGNAPASSVDNGGGAEYGYAWPGYDAAPVDTEYDINYKIFMTQLERDQAQEGEDESRENEEGEDVGENNDPQ
ncbi:hypothetical protein Poli38472_011004 [Pythium oligandrum]|uniref:WW domain-containing protein n=1 Tax=Pythium oligandrum TaxID=41045 RepID=A0A8K1CEH0_PYTOL|nr:hypothetical protein Poli38472_011004 [Pythium oligandrum]|eukprot:TMW61941.1 hypothetical protein Poli38472_011004 [Pythium oligandrum]